MAAELPRCAVCRVSIEPGQNVVFRSDGRVNHVECPPVICPVCSHPIRPEDPIRRDTDGLVHGNCWTRRYRSEPRPVVAGNAEPGRDIAALMRDRIAAGTLPRPLAANAKVWAGKGTGQPCDGCGRVIASFSVECEVELGERTLRFHRSCLAVWQNVDRLVAQQHAL